MRRILESVLVMVLGVAVAAGWTRYEARAQGFSLEYPTGWSVLKSGSTVRFAAVKDGLALAEFSVWTLPATSLEAWVKSRRGAETLPDGTSRVEAVRDTRLAGRAAKRLRLFAFDRYIAEEAVLVGKRLVVISFDDENPNDPQFKAHRAQYDHMRSSLQVQPLMPK